MARYFNGIIFQTTILAINSLDFSGCIFMVGSKIPLIHRSRSWLVICLEGGSLLVINGVEALITVTRVINYPVAHL